MNFSKVIISFFLILSTFLILVVPCFASDTIFDSTDFWSAVSDAASADDYLYTISEAAAFSGSTSPGCSVSSDGLHHWEPYYTATSLTGYCRVQCLYCNMAIKDYNETAYQDYVETLPVNGYSSSGGFYFYPSAEVCHYKSGVYGSTGRFYYPVSSACTETLSSSFSNWAVFSDISVNSSSVSFTVYNPNFCSSQENSLYIHYFFTAPSSGSYVLHYSYGATSTSLSSGSVIRVPYATSSTYSFTSGDSFDRTLCFELGTLVSHDSVSISYPAPYFIFTPSSSTDSSGNTYASYYTDNSRVNNISLNLGLYDQSTSTYDVTENVTVVNETTNIYTDPGTGTQYPINSWTYDYTDRKYSLSLNDNGTTINGTVEFGVDGLTVDLGGTTTEYSYMVETHTHEYTSSVTTAATCTGTGVKTYTCDVCNDTYTETIPALGHDYQLAEVEPFYYTLDTSDVLCPECDSANVICTQDGESSTFNCVCDDCEHTWTLTGSAVAGREKYVCSRCGNVTYDPIGEDEDMSDVPFWKWLQQWLIRFKVWLGEKLDNLDGDTTIVNQNIDQEITSSGNTFKISDILSKFGFLKDIYSIGKTLFNQVTSDALAAEEFTLFEDIGLEEETVSPSPTPLLTTAVLPPVTYAEAPTEGADGDDTSTTTTTTTENSILVNNVPTITVNLGAATSYYGVNYGTTATVLDLSWYTPYKSTVDNIVSGFLWLFFCWQLFKKAPGIIAGSDITTDQIADIDAGSKPRKRRN